MSFPAAELAAVGFPLLTALILIALYPLRLKDCFSQDAPTAGAESLASYQITTGDLLKIFFLYTACALTLGLTQALLLWKVDADNEALFSSRFTDYPLYPFIPSFVMAIFVTWFIIVLSARLRGREVMHDLMHRSYDGWEFAKEAPRFGAYVLAAGVLCTASNIWFNNIYVIITEDAFVYNDQRRLSEVAIDLDFIEYYEIVETVSADESNPERIYTLSVRLRDGSKLRTEKFLRHHKRILEDLDNLIKASEKNGNFDVVMSREVKQ